MELKNRNGKLNKYVQMLLDGLQGENSYHYVDLLANSLNSELDNWDDYCYYPNNDETIWMILEESSNSIIDSIRYFMTSEYDWDAPFIHVSDLATVEYDELGDLYIEMLTELDPYYKSALEITIDSIKDELIELSENL